MTVYPSVCLILTVCMKQRRSVPAELTLIPPLLKCICSFDHFEVKYECGEKNDRSAAVPMKSVIGCCCPDFFSTVMCLQYKVLHFTNVC